MKEEVTYSASMCISHIELGGDLDSHGVGFRNVKYRPGIVAQVLRTTCNHYTAYQSAAMLLVQVLAMCSVTAA